MRINTLVALAGAALMCLAVVASADPTLQVTFPEKGGYIHWMEFKDAVGKPEVTAPKHAQGTGTSVDLAPASLDGKLAAGELKIYDPKSGNVAVKSLQNLAGKKDLKLKAADFDRVRNAQIVLRPADGKPDERVESAVVTLKDANSDEFTAIVDPSSEGVAEFHDIAAGQESVMVAYEGGKMSVDLEAPADREAPIFTHTLAISSDVRTVKVSAASTPADGKQGGKPGSSKPARQAPGAGILPVLAGFVFLGLIGSILYVILKSKGVTVKDSLNKMGVQFPEGDDAGAAPGTQAGAPAPQVDPNVCQFCGQRKDASGNCACSIGGSAAGAASAGIPRLIGMQGSYSGRIFELTADNMTFGRDTSNAVPLPEDTTVSRRHARICRENSLCIISDEGSSNGTFVNGIKISGRQPLQPGDEVQIGSTKYRFES
jgi:hypothetical protein